MPAGASRCIHHARVLELALPRAGAGVIAGTGLVSGAGGYSWRSASSSRLKASAGPLPHELGRGSRVTRSKKATQVRPSVWEVSAAPEWGVRRYLPVARYPPHGVYSAPPAPMFHVKPNLQRLLLRPFSPVRGVRQPPPLAPPGYPYCSLADRATTEWNDPPATGTPPVPKAPRGDRRCSRWAA